MQTQRRLFSDHAVLVYVIPCALAVVCYINGLNGEFVHDDIFAIKNNPDVTGRYPISRLFTNDFWGTSIHDSKSHKSYRPLSVLTFRLDYFISGGNPRWCHLVNTLLHTCVTLMFTCVCLRVLHTSHMCALASSSMFAVHPVHTEAVTGLVGRAEVLAAFFFLSSFYTYSRCMTADPIKDKEVSCRELQTAITTKLLSSRMVYLLWSVMLSAAAMLCKETGITVLGLSLLFDLFLNGRKIIRDVSRVQLSATSLACLIRITCLILAGVLLLVFRLWIMNFQQPQVFSEESNPASFSESALTRILTFLYLPTLNLWLLLCPATLSYDWAGGSIPLLESLSDPRNLCSMILYTSVLVLLVVCLKTICAKNKDDVKTKQVGIIMSVCLMAVPFLPASNLFFRVGFVLAERVLYIPSMGYCLLVAHGLLAVCSRLPRIRVPLLVLYAGMLLVLTVRTVDRNRVWRSRQSLFWSGVRTLPHNDKVHYNLANLLKDEGNKQEAEEHYRIAINLNPKIASYHLNLGTLLTNKTEAQMCYQEALRLRPQHTGALVNMGSLLLDQENKTGMSLIKQALGIDPNHFEAVITMAYVMLVSENLTEAGRYSRHALNIKPDSAKAHLCHGIYLHNTGQIGTALREYEETLRLDPRDSNALLNSAKIYYTNGQLQEAKKQLDRALDVKKDCSECLTLLGSVYSRQGASKDAVITLGHASALAPNNTYTNLKYVQILKETHQHGKAWSVLQELLCRVPHHVDVLKFAFTFSMEEKQYKDALQYIQERIRIVEQAGANSLSILYRDQAEAHRLNNDSASAIKSLEKAVQLNSTFLEAIIDAGSIHFLQKNFAQAESYYLKAVGIDRNNQLAKLNLEKLRKNFPKSDSNKK